MKWIAWNMLYVLFLIFGTRTYAKPTLIGGEWHRTLFNWMLRIRVNDNYDQVAYTLYRDNAAIAGVVFDGR